MSAENNEMTSLLHSIKLTQNIPSGGIEIPFEHVEGIINVKHASEIILKRQQNEISNRMKRIWERGFSYPSPNRIHGEDIAFQMFPYKRYNIFRAIEVEKHRGWARNHTRAISEFINKLEQHCQNHIDAVNDAQ